MSWEDRHDWLDDEWAYDRYLEDKSAAENEIALYEAPYQHPAWHYGVNGKLLPQFKTIEFGHSDWGQGRSA